MPAVRCVIHTPVHPNSRAYSYYVPGGACRHWSSTQHRSHIRSLRTARCPLTAWAAYTLLWCWDHAESLWRRSVAGALRIRIQPWPTRSQDCYSGRWKDQSPYPTHPTRLLRPDFSRQPVPLSPPACVTPYPSLINTPTPPPPPGPDSSRQPELVGAVSMVRELHVYGTAVAVHARDTNNFQHQVGLGEDGQGVSIRAF